MKTELELAQYALHASYEDLPVEVIAVAKNMLLTVAGTTIAGANADGCRALVDQVRHWGGREEATVLVHGGRVPAHNAAFVNSVMARALDFCDAMVPGMHVGSSAIPTALATAELIGKCSGTEFIAAIAVGTEIASRLNLVSDYDGFDPTGVCSIFAATTIAGRLLRLDDEQMLNAFALALNRAGGSMQSNIDGSLAVRLIQGATSQAGIVCAQLAQIGMTGPGNFLEGIYGYFHLYAKGAFDTQALMSGLGQRYEMKNTLFKKYPSCGCTLGPTDAILALVEEKHIEPQDVARIEITVSPRAYKLVGHRFEMGTNPKVNAQFSVRYCVANALLRKSSKLRHFDEEAITDPRIMDLIKITDVYAEERPDRTEVAKLSIYNRVKVTTKAGQAFEISVDIPRGYPGNPLSSGEHLAHFRDCVEYANPPLPAGNIDKALSIIERIDETENVADIVPLLIERHMPGSAGLSSAVALSAHGR